MSVFTDPQFDIGPQAASTSADGMTLRDWFAGQALAGITTSIAGLPDVVWAQVAGDAYRAADALLAERAKTGEKA